MPEPQDIAALRETAEVLWPDAAGSVLGGLVKRLEGVLAEAGYSLLPISEVGGTDEAAVAGPLLLRGWRVRGLPTRGPRLTSPLAAGTTWAASARRSPRWRCGECRHEWGGAVARWSHYPGRPNLRRRGR